MILRTRGGTMCRVGSLLPSMPALVIAHPTNPSQFHLRPLSRVEPEVLRYYWVLLLSVLLRSEVPYLFVEQLPTAWCFIHPFPHQTSHHLPHQPRPIEVKTPRTEFTRACGNPPLVIPRGARVARLERAQTKRYLSSTLPYFELQSTTLPPHRL